MPQGSPSQGRAMPQGRLLTYFNCIHSIGNMLGFTIIFDYMKTMEFKFLFCGNYGFLTDFSTLIFQGYLA